MAVQSSSAPGRCSPGRRTRVMGGNGVIGRFVVARRLVARGARSLLQPRSDYPMRVADTVGACDNPRGDTIDAAGLRAVLREHRTVQIVHLGACLPVLSPRAREDLGDVAAADVGRIRATDAQTMRQLGLAPHAPRH